jgi:hypothetical protein
MLSVCGGRGTVWRKRRRSEIPHAPQYNCSLGGRGSVGECWCWVPCGATIAMPDRVLPAVWDVFLILYVVCYGNTLCWMDSRVDSVVAQDESISVPSLPTVDDSGTAMPTGGLGFLGAALLLYL